MKQIVTNHHLKRLLIGTVFLLLFVLACVWANRGGPGSGITESAGTEYETARVRFPKISKQRRKHFAALFCIRAA